MNLKSSKNSPLDVVYDEYVKDACVYYKQIIHKISPYLFDESLIKMIGFQQLIISKNYQIRRYDARARKKHDYIRECLMDIRKPEDLINLMESWYAFDLCFTAPSFVNPMVAANIRKNYCKIGSKYFDCKNCNRIVCKKNLIWNKSSILLDFDSKSSNLLEDFKNIEKNLMDLNLEYAIKLSSLKGIHINIGLPKDAGSTIFDRNLFHYVIIKELYSRNVLVDDNSLDPVPIIRAPFSLHYKRLTPSLCVDQDSIQQALKHLSEIESKPLNERIAASLDISKTWTLNWNVKFSDHSSFDRLLKKWGDEGKKAIYREKAYHDDKKNNVGDYLRKGKKMTSADEKKVISLFLQEDRTREFAAKIIEINRKKEPKPEKIEPSVVELILKKQSDIPDKILEIPPPLIFLIIDNASTSDLREIIGINPLALKSECVNTDEGMSLYFKNSKLFKRYKNKWNCNTIYIGGLYSAYNFCSQADEVIGFKESNIWDRDMEILEELKKRIDDKNNDKNEQFIASHLLGLDFCKDNNIEPSGAILTFKRIIKLLMNTNYSLILTSDHNDEKIIPYAEIFIPTNYKLDRVH